LRFAEQLERFIVPLLRIEVDRVQGTMLRTAIVFATTPRGPPGSASEPA
jgi:hypothetical protein